MSSIGQTGSGSTAHTPAASSSRRDPAATAYARPSKSGCSIGGSAARSTTATRAPPAAKRQASVPPTGPAPTTHTSSSCITIP